MKKVAIYLVVVILLIVILIFSNKHTKNYAHFLFYKFSMNLISYKDGLILPKYKMITHYSLSANLYSCSEPIEAKLVDITDRFGGKRKGYKPVDMNKASLVCRENGIQ